MEDPGLLSNGAEEVEKDGSLIDLGVSTKAEEELDPIKALK